MPDALYRRQIEALYDAAPIGIVVFDRDLRFVRVNQVLAEINGLSAAEHVGRRAEDVLAEPTMDMLRSVRAQLETHDDVPEIIVSGPNPTTGRMQHFRVAYRALRDANGGLSEMLGTVLDVTRQIEAEHALRASEERFRSFMRNSPMAAWIVDRDGRFVYANPGYARMFGVEGPIEGRTIADLYGEPLVSEYLRNNEAAIGAGEAVQALEHGVRADGGDGRFFVVKFPMPSPDGVQLVGGAALDVTAIAGAEKAARDSAALFAALFENAGVGIAQVAPDGAWLRVNRRMADILGYSPEELLRIRFQDVTHPDDLADDLALTRRVIAGDIDEFAMSKRYLHKDGSIVWARLSVRCVRDERGGVDYFVSVVEDISERKAAEARVQMLMNEVNHRAKNMLAVVQAIARQTARSSPTTFLERFSERVRSLAAAQDLLISRNWGAVPLDDLLVSQLAPFKDFIGQRIHISGPRVEIGPAAAQAIAMAVHELATNASKHGALSNRDGRVDVAWEVTEGERILLTWRETGRPPVLPPRTSGFGATVLGEMIRLTLKADVSIDYPPAGVIWRLDAPLASVLGEEKTTWRRAP